MPYVGEPLSEERARPRCGLWLAALVWVVLVGMYFGLARFLGSLPAHESSVPTSGAHER